jgi:HAD superfamily hydrolase (TIGR01509 family)
MTRPATGLRDIITGSRHVLLDFDGPVCSIFAGTPAPVIAEQLRHKLQAAGITLPAQAGAEDDPLEVFRIAASTGPEVAELAQREPARLETRAADTARPTPGAARFITAARQSGRTVTIVSNNSGHAITRYLDMHHLTAHVTAIIGRDDSDPARMKPSPYRVREAVSSLDANPAECVFVGDSPSDVLAGRLAGVAVIGYASKPGKSDALTQARADAMTTELAEITTALRQPPSAALPK